MTKTKFKNLFFFRSVRAGNSSFALSLAQDIGKLQSITLEFQGSGVYLHDAIVYSVADNKRYEFLASMLMRGARGIGNNGPASHPLYHIWTGFR